MTRFQLHCHTYAKGCGSDQCANANRVVLLRADRIPADVLFVGEAPGENENIIGKPFVGPAGRLLDHIITKGIGSLRMCPDCDKVMVPDGTVTECPSCLAGGTGRAIDMAFTNIVGCIPRDDDNNKASEPSFDQIQQCKPRLEEFISIVNPSLIVCVGAMARDALKRGYLHSPRVPDHTIIAHITHPAAILRSQVAAQGLMIQRCVIDLRDALLLTNKVTRGTTAPKPSFEERFPEIAAAARQVVAANTKRPPH